MFNCYLKFDIVIKKWIIIVNYYGVFKRTLMCNIALLMHANQINKCRKHCKAKFAVVKI